MGRPIKKGSTDQSTVIRIIDSTTGLPETAVEHNTSGIDLWYRREQSNKVALTEVALTSCAAAHLDGGIEHIVDGYYRLDLPDAACASLYGVNGVQIGGAITNMVVIGNEHALVDWNPYDSIRGGLIALPNAAANAAGGLPISAGGALALDTLLGRITGNVALASVVGALADAAADGDPSEAETLMQYLKQLINILIGSAGIPAFPAEAGPANDVSLAEVIRAIHVDVTGLNGDAMVGTDGANTTVPDAAGVAPTAAEIQAEMEENGASLLDTIRDELANETDGLSALKALLDAIPTTAMRGTDDAATETKQDIIDTVVDSLQTDLDNATDGLGALKTLIDAIKAKTDNQPAGVPKNVALTHFTFVMVDSDDHITPKAELTVTAQISKDGGAFAGASNSVAEISNGAYKVDGGYTQAEMNADIIMLRFTATGADDRLIIIKTSS